MSEAARTYQHFREIFGGEPRIRPGRARTRTREASGSEPFTPGRDPKPLGATIDALTAQLGWSGPLSQHELLATWPEIAGVEIAQHSEPIAIEGGERISIPAAPVSEVVDTTGAGDLFAAGFLTARCKDASLERCLWTGAIAAGEVIQHYGARPMSDLKKLVQL